ncbi:MAG: LacI family DNA-binding transcriptional regulator [Planctomycetota bacterium]
MPEPSTNQPRKSKPSRPVVPKRVTLREVAQLANAPVSTTSLILGNHKHASRYSEPTRRRILEAAQQLGSRPNYFATQLRNGTTNLLMCCVNRLSAEFATLVSEGFESVARARSYVTVMTSLQHRDLSVGSIA